MKILEDLEDHMASRRIKNHELSLVENHVSGGECFPNGTPHTNMCKKKHLRYQQILKRQIPMGT
jgi:hypothetical protein